MCLFSDAKSANEASRACVHHYIWNLWCPCVLTSARVPVATAPTLVRLTDTLPSAVLRPRVGARPVPGLYPARRLTLAPLGPVGQAAVNCGQVAHTCTHALGESDWQLDWIRHPRAPGVAVDDYINTRQQKAYPGWSLYKTLNLSSVNEIAHEVYGWPPVMWYDFKWF